MSFPSRPPKLAWLNRPSSTSSTPSSSNLQRPGHNKSLSIEHIPHSSRAGPLGSGASIVKTPHDALKQFMSTPQTSTTPAPPRPSRDEKARTSAGKAATSSPALGPTFERPSSEEILASATHSPPYSPPLPPLPLFAEDVRHRKAPSIDRSQVPSTSILMQQVPESRVYVQEPETPLSELYPTPPQEEFTPYLLSGVPSMSNTNILVVLETSTVTHRTTLSTLTSRTSHLSGYLVSLFANDIPDDEEGEERIADDTCSVTSLRHEPRQTVPEEYEEEDSISEAYRQHLRSEGLWKKEVSLATIAPPEPPASTSRDIHIFLDRPSESYGHILSYLRSPASHEALPRAVQLRHGAPVETLLALRDEAAYLGISSLVALCTEELDARSRKLAARGSLQAIVYQSDNDQATPGRSSGFGSDSHLPTLPEQIEPAPSVSTTGSKSLPPSSPPTRTLPDTPQSMPSPKLRSSRSPDALSRRPLYPTKSPKHYPITSSPPKPGFF